MGNQRGARGGRYLNQGQEVALSLGRQTASQTVVLITLCVHGICAIVSVKPRETVDRKKKVDAQHSRNLEEILRPRETIPHRMHATRANTRTSTSSGERERCKVKGLIGSW